MKQKKSRFWFVYCVVLLVIFFVLYDKDNLVLSLDMSSKEAILTFNPQTDIVVASGSTIAINQGLLAVGYTKQRNLQTLRTLLQFDITSIPKDSQVISATLSLTSTASTGTSTYPEMTIVVQRVLDEWPETINWQEHLRLRLDETITVPVTFGPTITHYQWNITPIVQAWVKDQQPTGYLGLIIKGDESADEHQRAFKSKDCTSCTEDQKPRLSVQFNTPTLTPTPTDTPTPTPTQGIRSLTLSNSPEGAILPGEEVTYTIYLENGWLPLTNVVFSNKIPPSMVFVSGSMNSDSDFVVTTALPPSANNQISWQIVGDLLTNQRGQFSYRAARETPTYTPTPTPTYTPTSTDTSTPTYTPTNTTVPSATPTSSNTPIPTHTNVPTLTETPTETFTPLPTYTPYPTYTPFPTSTSTPTLTSTITPTGTRTSPTMTFTPTHTETPTPTWTPTSTDTPTNTPVPTRTYTPTSTAQPTATFTPTPSITPTPSPTPTHTFTPTATITPTPTFTPTNTATSTVTPTVLPVINNGVFMTWRYQSTPQASQSNRTTNSSTSTTSKVYLPVVSR